MELFMRVNKTFCLNNEVSRFFMAEIYWSQVERASNEF